MKLSFFQQNMSRHVTFLQKMSFHFVWSDVACVSMQLLDVSFCLPICVSQCDWFNFHICSLSFISRTRLQLQPAGGNVSYLKKSEPHQVSKWRRGEWGRDREGGREEQWEQKEWCRGKENDKARWEKAGWVDWGSQKWDAQRSGEEGLVLLRLDRCGGHRGEEMEMWKGKKPEWVSKMWRK